MLRRPAFAQVRLISSTRALAVVALAVMVGCAPAAPTGAPVPAATSATAAQTGPAAPARQVTLRFGDQVGSELDYGALWIAQEQGYLKEAGITVERRSFENGPAALLAYNKGELDIIMAGITPYLQAAAEGARLKIVMSVTKDNAPVVASRGIQTIKDLDGKKVGTPGVGTIQDTVFLNLEKQNGIKTEHVYAKITDLVAMLEKGEIAALCGWETVAAEAVARVDGAHYLVPKPMPGAESLELAVTPKLAAEQPEVVQGLVTALVKGIRYYQANEPEALNAIAKVMNRPDALKIAQLGKNQVDITKPRLDMESSRMWLNLAIESNKIRKDQVPYPNRFIESLVDYSFLDKAEAQLKDWKPSP